jgi:hypothetical protein
MRTAFIVYYDHPDDQRPPVIGDVYWTLRDAEEEWRLLGHRTLHVTDLTPAMLEHHHLPNEVK